MIDVQEAIEKSVIRLFNRRGWFNDDEVERILEYENTGFSLDAKVRIQAWDRDGLERLLILMLLKNSDFQFFQLVMQLIFSKSLVNPEIGRRLLTHPLRPQVYRYASCYKTISYVPVS